MVYKKGEKMAKNEEWMTVIQLAAVLGITRAAVYKKMEKGQIPFEVIGGRYLISKKEIKGLLPRELTASEKAEIEKSVAKVVREYGATLKMLGKE